VLNKGCSGQFEQPFLAHKNMNREKMIKLAFTGLLMVTVCFARAQQRTTIVSVGHYGAIANSGKDATKAIARAIDACRRLPKSVLYFPKGRYDIYPDSAVQKEYYISNTSTKEECPDKTKTIGLFFQGIKNLTIEGNGSELIYHDKMITLAFDNCENILIRDLEEDYARPTMSELQFVYVGPDHIDARVGPGSRYKIANGRLVWYDDHWVTSHFHAVMLDTATNEMTYSNWPHLEACHTVELAANLVRFENPGKFQPKVGNVLTIRDIIRDEVGMFILKCKNVRLEKVAMHYMHGLGIVSQFSENIAMERVECAPKEGSGRYMASSADFMHFSGCKGLVDIENSQFSGAHDDPINVHGTYLRIVDIPASNKVVVRFMHGQSYGFDAFFAGDTIGFIHTKSLQQFGVSKIIRAIRINETDMELTLRTPVPRGMEKDDCVENITWTPRVIIRNNSFTRTNTRGILVTTRKRMIIEHNVFRQVGMNAIFISADASGWFESGAVKDVLIRDNSFWGGSYNGGAGNAVIAIEPTNTLVDSARPVHENITIEGNRFYVRDHPIVYAKSVRGLTVTNNLVMSERAVVPPPAEDSYVKLSGCSHWAVKNNRFVEHAQNNGN
jgi:hypothetical protein